MKEKKTIMILILVLTVGIVGLTIAYFSNSSTITNEFSTNPYGTTVTEEFVSPTNWLPGTTTTKTVKAHNTGSVDEAVRVSISENWKTHNNGTLSGWIHLDGTKSTHSTETELSTDERVAVLNLANTSDWTKVGNYYYYNYRIAPGEETSSFLESVTFNPKIKLDDTCETTIGEGTKTITCTSSGDDYDHATYTLTINIETVQYNKYNEAWNLNNSVSIASTSKPVVVEPEEPDTPVVTPTGAETLATTATNASDAEYNDTTKKNMFVFTHGEGANQVTETRYIGDAPNNYVYFNCDDMDNQSASTCEVWRIIGVFNVERTDPEHEGQTISETRMKLVRGSDLATNMVFDSSFNNDWTVSPLKTFLNGDYYNASGDAATYGLKASARNIIGDAKYYLGAVSADWNATAPYGTTEKIYGEERGNTVCGACNSDITKLTWTGSVGLMYPSDEYMVYGNGVNSTCYTNPNGCSGTNAQTGWVYKSNVLEGQTSPNYTWFLSSPAGGSDTVLSANSDGYLHYDGSNISDGVRPVVYLKSDIKITEGTGEVGNPYVLK